MDFIYTADMQDKDTTNAFSAAYRTVRDAIGLPVDTEGKPSQESKALHTSAGNAARTTVLAVKKGLIARKKRADWTPEIAKKAFRLCVAKGLDAYCAIMEAEGYEIDENLKTQAIAAYGTRLQERRILTEAQWNTEQGLNAGGELDDVFA